MPLLLVALNAKYVHTNLAVRSLRAYAGGKIFEAPLQEPVHKLAQKIFSLAPLGALVGFSCYLWNISLVEQLCDRLSKMRGDIRIVLGGPEVSFDAADTLARNPAVYYVICGEGEAPLRALLQTHACGDTDTRESTAALEHVPSLCYRQNGRIICNPPASLLPLADIPFAYERLTTELEGRIIYYETSRGCPFRCQFCLSADTGVRFLPLDRALNELTHFSGQGARQVKLVDRTFNADPVRARAIWRRLIALDTRTNFHFEIAAHLLGEEDFLLLAEAPAGRFQFEIGVQSTYAPARQAVRRTEPLGAIRRAVTRLREMGNIHLHLDLIAGLPLEDLAHFAQSYDDIAALRPHALQLGVLKGLKGSGVRADAARYGLQFAAHPPYDVLRTHAMSAADILRLTRMADIASRFIESGHCPATIALLRLLFSPFALLDALETALSDVPREAQPVREALAAFTRSQDVDQTALTDCLAYDWLLEQKRGYLPAYTSAVLSPEQEQRARRFYRDEAKKHLPHLREPAWRFAHLHPVHTDVPTLCQSGVLRSAQGYVLFDYARVCPPQFLLLGNR